MVSYKSEYKPEISPKVLKLAKKISDRFEDIQHCIWEIKWLNEFTLNQSNKRIILIEIEKDFVESLYYELKDSFRDNLFLNPDKKTIDFYIAESNDPIIIKKLITRSPTSKRIEKGVTFYTPLLEKLLVDLFAEKKLFYFYQGSEMMHIYENALKNYSINFTKLFSYANRREREQDIKAFLKINMHHLVKDIIDD